jgi:hypothetical protein
MRVADAVRDLQSKVGEAERKYSGLAASHHATEACQEAPRDEIGAFQRSLPELIVLDRYERRAFSRRKRAMRIFEAISVVARFQGRETKGR